MLAIGNDFVPTIESVMSQTKLEQPNHVADTIEVTQLKLPSCWGFKNLLCLYSVSSIWLQ